MKRSKIITADTAVRLIQDADTVALSGFVGTSCPEELAEAVEKRFLATGTPRNLTLVYAGGPGDGNTRGANHFAREGLVSRIIGGYWGMVPRLVELAMENKTEAYCFPMGVISHLFRDIASGRPGAITPVGLHTFIDPRVEGGRVNAATTRDLVEVITLHGKDYLFFPAFPIQVALLRGTSADEEGNVTMEKEAVTLDVLPIAQAAKNSGGIVIVQVEQITTERPASPQAVRIPGTLVDGVVIARPENHMQTFAESYNAAYISSDNETKSLKTSISSLPLTVRKVIGRRAAMFLTRNAVVNLGIGIPETVALIANEEDVLDWITLTVESGGIGGIPAGGLSFGAVAGAQAIIDQPYQFDFYDGGGLDQSFLGMAEVDEKGNVNVSKFGSRFTGAGGFINISQNAKAAYFMGTFMVGGQVSIKDGRLSIESNGTAKKFVRQVHQVTFNGSAAYRRNQPAFYITERCVFRLTAKGLELLEIAPGVDLDRDILTNMEFRPQIAEDLHEMDPLIFRDALMGLGHRFP